MARKAKPSSRTNIQFIAADDESIGVDIEKNPKAYAEYSQDMDERHLELTGEPPSYYHLKVLPFDLHAKVVDALRSDDDDEDAKVSAEKVFSPTGRLVITEFLTRCLLGVDSHAYVTRINPDGSFEEAVLTWQAGHPRPPDLIEVLLSDESLCISLLFFAIRASQLTGEEKKR